MRESREPLAIVAPGLMEYQQAWDLQRSIADARVAGTGPDTLIVLEHPPVYTAGRRTNAVDRPVNGTPVIDVDRGGSITYHGPGQLVAYPIVRLAEAMFVVAYVRVLEQAIIATCRELGLDPIRVPGRSGVWFAADAGRPERKVAALGVRVAKGVTSHGLSLNCDPDLSAFERIVPCGIADAGVTSLTAELGRRVTVGEVTPVIVRHLTAALDGDLPVEPARRSDRPGPVTIPAPTATPAPDGVQWALAPALRSS
ncbi:lipoyl(octanoyl) transferase LipB [Nakamurella deserti]|uniref:lipoyl(octanoyl) transferase LipB n=1 Tax=Nakamurella deserti TaxID=2164074 RepID=UPI000DBE269F|nr:lipoyl(octanoyl) transferase LipB [Nakamurella deserti]